MKLKLTTAVLVTVGTLTIGAGALSAAGPTDGVRSGNTPRDTCMHTHGFPSNLSSGISGAWGSTSFAEDSGPLTLNVNAGYTVTICTKKGADNSFGGAMVAGTFTADGSPHTIFHATAPGQGFSHYGLTWTTTTTAPEETTTTTAPEETTTTTAPEESTTTTAPEESTTTTAPEQTPPSPEQTPPGPEQAPPPGLPTPEVVSPLPPAVDQAPPPAVVTPVAPAPAPVAAQLPRSLPSTGTSSWLVAAIATALLGAGFGFRQLARREY